MILRNVNDILTLDGAGIDSETLSDMRSQNVQTESMIWYYTRCTDYYGPWEYVNGRLNRINISGGFIYGDSVYCNISDHQGNIRQVWNATTGQTVQDNHYYPYGALFGESASTEYVKAMARNGNNYKEISNLIIKII